MSSNLQQYFWFLFRLYVISLILGPFVQKARALGEYFELYRAPQAVLMGDALTADVSGYASNYYNPAGLSNFTKRTKEVTLLDLEGSLGFAAIQKCGEAMTFGTYRLFGKMKQSPGSYNYFNFSSVPGFAIRGFSFSLLGVYEYAAESDGTNIDIQSRQDVGATVGFSRALAGNLLKVGVVGKAIIRNQIQGVYAHSLIESLDDSTIPTLYKEGLGFGADIGMTLTIPNKTLPTLGLVWKDILGTHFSSGNIINKKASGAPNAIEQTFNAAFSIHPYFTRRFKGTIAVEWKHIEETSMAWKKHLKLGLQLEDDRSLYFWFGLNQLYPTLGLGLRVKGGNLEAGTYAEDVGTGSESKADRRFVFRYTIGF